ncbi:MAG: type I DNA topoisomerase [Candidatus Izemoplasmatales bacterium]
MAKKVVIVESPSKSKTISKYLGSGYTVTASVGHIRDLATTGKGGLGIDVDNDFKPNYQILPKKKKVVTDLNKMIKDAEEIYLATDPDREGEAISWHLFDTLNIKEQDVKRVVFNEITKEAVTKAFLNPRKINFDLVSSQETRRMLDRIIGFKLSMLLKSKIKSQSAGRVQSAALKLIVDLEKEIEAFVIEEYYEIFAKFKDVEAKLFKVNLTEKPDIKSEVEANNTLKALDKNFIVQEVSKKENKSYPRPALITSTLQQNASSFYGYSSSKTMSIAQKLYEGIEIDGEPIGLITYMRTDSTRLSEEFISESRNYIKKDFGSEYLGYYRIPKNKENAQDAHEAIRPTSIYRNPESIKKYLTSQEYKIYKLIYNKALGSLMSPAINELTTLLLENNKYIFKATSSKPVFDGYLKLTRDFDSEENDVMDLSSFKEKSIINADEVFKKQLFTSPPARFTEAKLIKTMEELGIGRPSTYAATVDTLLKRKYILKEEKKFVPTDQGKLTIEKLDDFFHEFISADYSRDMESILDSIANGDELQLNVLQDFYNYFMPLVDNAKENMEKVKPIETGELCPKCGSPMVYKTSKYGKFEACSNYPSCKYIKEEKKDKPEVKDTKVECPECKIGTLVLRTAKKGKNKGNKFLACSRFPKCKYISPLEVVDQTCPDCDNVVVKDESNNLRCISGKKCE